MDVVEVFIWPFHCDAIRQRKSFFTYHLDDYAVVEELGILVSRLKFPNFDVENRVVRSLKGARAHFKIPRWVVEIT